MNPPKASGTRRSDRRAFVAGAFSTAASLALPRFVFAQRVVSPVRVGLAGFGARGGRLGGVAAGLPGVTVVAVADPYSGRRTRAREVLGDRVAVMPDGRDLLGRADVDALLVATPDHLHTPLVRGALAQGKDVYCESPFTHAAEAGPALQGELAKTDRVVMCSAGRVGTPLLQRARELIREGRLGRVTLASASWNTGTALDAWLTSYPPDASPESIDFAAFEGSTPQHPFDLARVFRWRRYWEYGTGLAGERFAPQLSAIHWLLGCGAPRHVVAAGGVHRWRDGREVPDTLVASLNYEGGLSVNLSATQNGGSAERIQLIGTEGSLAIEGGELLLEPGPGDEPYKHLGETWPEPYRDWFYMIHGLAPDGGPRGAPSVPRIAERYRSASSGAAEPALVEFIASVRSRQNPEEGPRHALDVAAAVHAVNRAYRQPASAARSDLAGAEASRVA